MKVERKDKRNVPNLRFPDFEGGWGITKVGEVCKILMCKRVFANQTSETGEIPFYKIGTIGGLADSYISQQLFENYKNKYNYPRIGEVLITCSGTVGKCVAFDGENSWFQDSNIVWIDNEKLKFENSFLFYVLANYNWNKLNSTTIKRIYSLDLKNLKIIHPKREEQQKITSFLYFIDKRLQTQIEIIDNLTVQLKNLSHKLLNQELRLQNDEGASYTEWELKKLSDVCEKMSSNISANKIEDNFGEYILYGASGILKYIDFYREENDFISIVKDGAGVGRLLYCMGKSSVLGTMDVIKPKKNINSHFLYYLLETINFTKYITGSTIPHIYFKDYKKETFYIPSSDEQTKIANFLNTISEKLETEKKLLEQFQNQKKYFLQNLFI